MPESNRAATAKNIIKTPMLRNVFIVSLIVAIAIPILSAFWIIPAFTQQLTTNTEDQVVRSATHLMSTIIVREGDLKKESLSASRIGELEIVSRDLQLEKLKIFSKSGETIFSTDAEDIGKINKMDYFNNTVAKGNVFTKVVRKDSLSSEGWVVESDVMETYVPIMRNSTFMGAFEIYYDITDSKKKLDSLLIRTYSLLFGIAAILLLTVIAILFKASQNMMERDQASDALKRAHDNLENRVDERTEEQTRTNEFLKMEIAERKRAEKTLRESEEKYRILFEGSKDAISFVTSEGNIIEANQSYLDLFGYTREELFDFKIHDAYVDPDDRFLFKRDIEKNGTVKDFYVKLRKKDGTEMDCLLTATVRRSIEGDILGYHGSIHDITELKRSAEVLQESEGRYRALFEDNPIETIVVDKDARIMMYNRAKRTSGKRLPLIGDVMYRDYAAGHPIDMRKELMECIRQGKSKNFMEQNYHDDSLTSGYSPLRKALLLQRLTRPIKRTWRPNSTKPKRWRSSVPLPEGWRMI